MIERTTLSIILCSCPSESVQQLYRMGERWGQLPASPWRYRGRSSRGNRRHGWLGPRGLVTDGPHCNDQIAVGSNVAQKPAESVPCIGTGAIPPDHHGESPCRSQIGGMIDRM